MIFYPRNGTKSPLLCCEVQSRTWLGLPSLKGKIHSSWAFVSHMSGVCDVVVGFGGVWVVAVGLGLAVVAMEVVGELQSLASKTELAPGRG